MPKFIYEGQTVFDMFEKIIEHNAAVPARRRYARDDIRSVGLNKGEWMSMLALKRANQGGLVEHLVMANENDIQCTYRNLHVYYSGDESTNTEVSEVMQIITPYPEQIEDVPQEAPAPTLDYNWAMTTPMPRGLQATERGNRASPTQTRPNTMRFDTTAVPDLTYYAGIGNN